MSKKALTVISFGTTYPAARQAIEQIEKSLQEALPEYDFFRAFTSGMVIRKIERQEGTRIPNPSELMAQLAAEGYDEVLCQSLHIMPGIEYEKMLAQMEPYREGFSSFVVGKPMLFSTQDYEHICTGLLESLPPLDDDAAYVYMGHGTDHFAGAAYSQLQTMFDFVGEDRVLVGTVEGFPDLSYIRHSLKKRGIRKVHLAPFMIVAGDHAQNDLAGEEDSWKSILEAEGYEITLHMQGLGEKETVRALFVRHARAALEKTS